MNADSANSKLPDDGAMRKPRYSPWPHRCAIAMACVTFPLIWVGGLVTTYDAGMAVEDWPGTYGYNLFLYPIESWVFGPWDLMIEHGHRLMGSAAGLATICFVIACWRCDSRPWMRWLSLVALALVIGQGMLGGIRVLAVDREIAKVHGCVGPAFFAMCAALAVMTSRRWHQASDRRPTWDRAAGAKIGRLSALVSVFAYVQLILGANLRHIAVDADPYTYRTLIILHLVMAAVVAIHVALLHLSVRRTSDRPSGIRGPSFLLSILVIAQLALGAGTWIVKFGWPSFMNDLALTAGYMPIAKSMLQTNVITAHVAIGSLILAVSVVLAARAFRFTSVIPARAPESFVAVGATP